jgi:DNA-binding LytR/AlgR family response regulator
MNVARELNNVYEEFEENDILFFKLGRRVKGVVCFHGKNYSIRKRMTADQVNKLMSQSNFVQICSDCFVNVKQIKLIENEIIYFGEPWSESKHIPVSKAKQQQLRTFLAQAT